jgi:hypothetical protein
MLPRIGRRGVAFRGISRSLKALASSERGNESLLGCLDEGDTRCAHPQRSFVPRGNDLYQGRTDAFEQWTTRVHRRARLVVEVTETAALSLPDSALDARESLSELGVAVSTWTTSAPGTPPSRCSGICR